MKSERSTPNPKPQTPRPETGNRAEGLDDLAQNLVKLAKDGAPPDEPLGPEGLGGSLKRAPLRALGFV